MYSQTHIHENEGSSIGPDLYLRTRSARATERTWEGSGIRVRAHTHGTGKRENEGGFEGGSRGAHTHRHGRPEKEQGRVRAHTHGWRAASHGTAHLRSRQ